MARLFSDFYSVWLKRHQRDLDESIATCDLCPMAGQKKGYDSVAKCCNYFPFMPNFLIGAVIENAELAAQERLSLALKKGRITPLGLFPPLVQSAADPCPFFDLKKLNCSIWAERPAVCASFICQSSYSDAGKLLWKAAEDLGNLFEWTMAQDVLWRLGFTQDEIRLMERSDHSVWPDGCGDSFEFFRRSYQTALKVAPSEIEHLLGDEGETLFHAIGRFFAADQSRELC